MSQELTANLTANRYPLTAKLGAKSQELTANSGARSYELRAIILCAGYGTRLYPLTKDTPKALLPIRTRPVLSYIVDKLNTIEGLTGIIVVTNDRFYSRFKEWRDNYPARVPIEVINDGSKNHKDRRGAIGDLAFVINEKKIGHDILVIGGDNVFDFSLSDFIKTSLRTHPNPVIGIYNLNGRARAKKYGVVKTARDGRVIDFYEKPSRLNGSRLVSLCLYYLPKPTLSLLETYISESLRAKSQELKAELTANRYSLNANLDSIGNYIKWLVKNHHVYGYKFEGTWFDIGDIDSYTEAVCSF